MATIAFLKKDIETLKASRQEMASGGQTPGNSTNLKIVDDFIKCFDKTYRQVYMSKQAP
jgi:hypothetical protein